MQTPESPRRAGKPKRSKEETRQIVHYAELMVKMRARACVISELTGLPSLEVRDLWQRVAGRSSPSGQQPNDLAWYLKSSRRRFHSALIVQLYHQALQDLPAYAAMTNAYYHYGQITAASAPRSSWIDGADPSFRGEERDYEVPFSRANYLCKAYTNDKLANGRRKCPLVIKSCRNPSCQALFMSSEDEVREHCTVCAK